MRLVKPEKVEERCADPVVVESVQAVRDAPLSDVCGWVREHLLQIASGVTFAK